MNEIDWPALLASARAVRANAYAPESNFAVGAALLGSRGAIYVGCNVENASYGLTMCAERVAIGAAVAAGERQIVAICVIGELPEPITPCGACRQVLCQFADDETPILLANAAGDTRLTTVGDLLPFAFRFERQTPTT